ncbi:MAG: flagellar export chaperone FliS [Planctomycetota bacterium]|jgi:flagellar protein FliS
MESNVRDRYIEADVMTATPQKRQLMLLEAAIRYIQRTRHHWRAEEDDQACESLIRSQSIVAELLAALDKQVDPDLTKRVAGLYLFVFRALIEANSRRDETKLDEALRVLEPQREAWEGVCRELGTALEEEAGARAASLDSEAHVSAPAAIPVVPVDPEGVGEPPTSLSLEG